MRHSIIRITIGIIFLITAVLSIFRANTFGIIFSAIMGVVFLTSGLKIYKNNKWSDK